MSIQNCRPLVRDVLDEKDSPISTSNTDWVSRQQFSPKNSIFLILTPTKEVHSKYIYNSAEPYYLGVGRKILPNSTSIVQRGI